MSEPVALPDILPGYSDPDTEEFKAYNKCRTYKTKAEVPPIKKKEFTDLMAARLLGYALVYAPTNEGRYKMSTEINSCGDYSAFYDLAHLFLKHFIRCFRRAKGRTPAPSSHPSRKSFDDDKERIKGVLQQGNTNHTKAKEMALKRDSRKCMITGLYDNLVKPIAVKLNITLADTVHTNACHIIPESINCRIESDKSKEHYSATVWAMIERYAGGLHFQDLNGPQIHRLENIMTLCMEAHAYMDDLEVWLEATDTPNKYNVCAANKISMTHFPKTVTFTANPKYAELPLPSPQYLALHAACCKIAHMSGAININQKNSDEEELVELLLGL